MTDIAHSDDHIQSWEPHCPTCREERLEVLHRVAANLQTRIARSSSPLARSIFQEQAAEVKAQMTALERGL